MNLAILASAAAVAAGSWSTGAYHGTIAGDYGSSHRDGTIRLTVGKTRAVLDRFTVTLDCNDHRTRTFTVVAGDRGRLNRGPAGAGVSIQGRATVDGFDLDFGLVGGVQRNRFRGNFGAGADGEVDGGSVSCAYDGYFSTKR